MRLNVAVLVGALVVEPRSFLAAKAEAAAAVRTDLPPVSVAMQCTVNLLIQWFLVYTFMALVRTHNELNKTAPWTRAAHILNGMVQSVNLAPMLCVLFLGVRMRALQLAQGDPALYELPQWWVEVSMRTCTWTLLVQTVMVLLVPLVVDEPPARMRGNTHAADGLPGAKSATNLAAKIFMAIRYAALFVLYAGFTAICAGAFLMPAPEAVWPDGKRCGVFTIRDGSKCAGAPPVSSAVLCTMFLSAQYFGIYLGLAVVQNVIDLRGRSEWLDKLEGVLIMTTHTVAFAPMLCILFMGARMRALQIDPVAGNPQDWAQVAMYVCTGALLAQLLTILFIPLVLGGTVDREPGSAEGDVSFRLPTSGDQSPRTGLKVLTVFRFLMLLLLYGGIVAVILSVHTIRDLEGKRPVVSASMHCVMTLTGQYFLVYLLLFAASTIKQFFESAKDLMSVWVPTFIAAEKAVAFCPMLSVLFVGLRLRALQMTNQRGNPQGWAQQGMFLCVYAVGLQLTCVCVLPFFTGRSPSTDEDGNVVITPRTKEGAGAAAYLLVACRFVALVALYGGAAACVYALYTITPETANGEGLLLPNIALPEPRGIEEEVMGQLIH